MFDVVGFVWICVEPFSLKASVMGILRKLSEAKGSPDALFLNLESLNVADLLRGTTRDGRKDHKHGRRCQERRQVYAEIPPALLHFDCS